MDLTRLETEQQNSRTMNLDEMSTLEIVRAMNKEDHYVPEAISQKLPVIANCIDVIARQFKKGGRLFYIGAGTSGRLGVLDAAECVPTFGTDPEMVQGLIAGGMPAMTLAVEGAEDAVGLGQQYLVDRKLSPDDVVVGIAASGRTPYVIGGLDYAKQNHTPTIAFSCNKDAEISNHADIAIEISAGPEVLSGSTRLKAGSVQKMVLNMLSTASMVRIGKTYGNLMVDVRQTNGKLIERAIEMIQTVTGVSHDKAKSTLNLADHSVKVAIVMILKNVDANQAKARLENADGFVRGAIQ